MAFTMEAAKLNLIRVEMQVAAGCTKQSQERLSWMQPLQYSKLPDGDSE